MFAVYAKALCACSLSVSLITNAAFSVPPDTLSRVTEGVVSESSLSPEHARLLHLLGSHGYSKSELDVLLTRFSFDGLEHLLSSPYSPFIPQVAAQPHFQEDRMQRYVEYGQAHPDYSPERLVTRVNMDLDFPFYSTIHQPQNPSAIDVLVNKYNTLGTSFVPKLVQMDSHYSGSDGGYMHHDAYKWFVKMVDAAQAEGLRLYSVSAYRSAKLQKSIYQRYVNDYGVSLADIYSARPGHSEHQTGLAVDINVARRTAHFENTPHYRWLIKNSWKYGFILRYPKDKTKITGFTFEPWHYRYVGQNLAEKVYKSGLTLEEYLASQPTSHSVG